MHKRTQLPETAVKCNKKHDFFQWQLHGILRISDSEYGNPYENFPFRRESGMTRYRVMRDSHLNGDVVFLSVISRSRLRTLHLKHKEILGDVRPALHTKKYLKTKKWADKKGNES